MMTIEERAAKIEEFNKKHNPTVAPKEYPRLILEYQDAKTGSWKAFVPEENKRYDLSPNYYPLTGRRSREISDKSFKKEDRDNYFQAGSIIRLPYIKYDEELGILKLGQVCDPGRRSKDEFRTMDFKETYIESLYAFKGDKTLYKANGHTIKEETVRYREHREYAMLGKYISYVISNWDYQFFINVRPDLVKYIGSETWIGPAYTEYKIENFYDFQRYMEYKSTPKKPKNIDSEKEIISKIDKKIELKNEYEEYLTEKTTKRSYYDNKIALYKKVDGADVIAVYSQEYRYSSGRYDRGTNLNLVNVCIIGDKNISVYTTKRHVEGVKRVTTGYDADLNRTKIWNIDELYTNVERMKYIKDILKDSPDQVAVIVGITRHPEIELLCKAGATAVGKKIMADMNSIPSTEKMIFGDDFNYRKSKSLSENIGISNKQLVAFDKIFAEKYGEGRERYRRNERVLRNLKKDFKDINHWDIEKFEKRCKMYFDMSDIQYSACWRWDTRTDSYTIKTALQERFTFSDDEFEKLITRFESFKGDVDWAKSISDTMNQMDRVDETHKEIFSHKLLTAKTERDIIGLHDEVTTYMVEKRSELKKIELDNLNKRMKKTDEKRKDLQFEDKDFIIKLPDHIIDLDKEGAILSHCVGGYKINHASGETTILFLRKREYLDVPFYTIEVKDNRVIQIHGSHNRWLGNDPDAIPTVMRWLKKTGIICEENILTNTSFGYWGGSGGHVALPTI